MTQSPLTGPADKQDPLALVREGMRVYDRNDKEIGKVSGLFMGAAADQYEGSGVIPETAAGSEPVAGDTSGLDFPELLDPNGRLPAVLRNRLRYNGFVRIDSGLFRSDRYALREHVAAVAGDQVRLGVAAEELITI